MEESENLSRLGNVAHVASTTGASRSYVQKVADELMTHGYLMEGTRPTHGEMGCPGRTKLTVLDCWYIIHLYREEPSRTLRSYANQLEVVSGVSVSRQTIYNILTKAFTLSSIVFT